MFCIHKTLAFSPKGSKKVSHKNARKRKKRIKPFALEERQYSYKVIYINQIIFAYNVRILYTMYYTFYNRQLF